MTVTFSLHEASLHEAKAKLSELVSLAETGETIEITGHGKVVAHSRSVRSAPGRPGADREPRDDDR